MNDIRIIDENFYQEIMAKSKLELPFSDFEDNVMSKIERNVSNKPIIYVKLSWIFFVVGSMCGIVVSLILPRLHGTFLGLLPNKLTMVFQIAFTLIFFFQIDILINLIRKYKLAAIKKT